MSQSTRKIKQTYRAEQAKVTKDVSALNIGIQSTATNEGQTVSIIVKYDNPSIVLVDIPVIQRNFDQVNTIAKVKMQLEQCPGVVGALDEFYNLSISRDHSASYAVVTHGPRGSTERRKLSNEPLSHPQPRSVEVILDVTNSVVRCEQYRAVDDLNKETITNFESGADAKAKVKMIQDLSKQVEVHEGTIAFQKGRLSEYFTRDQEQKKELEKLRFLPGVVGRLDERVKELEQQLEAAQLQQVPMLPPFPGRVTRSQSGRHSVSGSSNPAAGFGGMGAPSFPRSGSRGSLSGGNAQGNVGGSVTRGQVGGSGSRSSGNAGGPRGSTGNASYQG